MTFSLFSSLFSSRSDFLSLRRLENSPPAGEKTRRTDSSEPQKVQRGEKGGENECRVGFSRYLRRFLRPADFLRAEKTNEILALHLEAVEAFRITGPQDPPPVTGVGRPSAPRADRTTQHQRGGLSTLHGRATRLRPGQRACQSQAIRPHGHPAAGHPAAWLSSVDPSGVGFRLRNHTRGIACVRNLAS